MNSPIGMAGSAAHSLGLTEGGGKAAVARALAVALLLGLAAIAYFRAAEHEVKLYATIFYLVSYSDGLIRRGLAGEIVSWFIDQRDIAAVRHAVTIAYTVLVVVFLACLFAWTIVLARRRRDYLLLGLLAVFLTSQFVPVVAHDAGFLDLYDYLLVLIAAVGFVRDRWIVVAFAGLVGPFVHEAFIFCWMPLAMVVAWERTSAGRIALLLSPLVSTALIYFGVSPEVTEARVMATAMSEGDKAQFVRWHFGQTFLSNLEMMIWKIRHNAINTTVGIVFSTLPAMVMVAVYGAIRRRWIDTAVLAGASFVSLSILLVAWDLSRLSVPASFFALLTILYMESVRPAGHCRWPAVAVCVAASILFVQVPVVYAFFEFATVADTGRPLDTRSWPIGRLTERGVRYFSRNIGPKFIDQIGHESPPGAVWYVEESAWRGVWLRRPGTDVYDATMTLAGDVVVYVVKIERSGNTIIARRIAPADARLDYLGMLEGRHIRGTYEGGPWTATIRYY